MPLDRFVLIVVTVLAAAEVSVLLAALALSSGALPGVGLGVAGVLALAAYVLVRVISDRMRSAEDDRYDRVEK